jgi:hypothetical protein
MVWEQEVSIIVMLTGLEEKGTVSNSLISSVYLIGPL